MGLNCCQYSNIGYVDACRPRFTFEDNALQSITLKVQFNGVVREFDVVTDSDGLVDLTESLIAGVHYLMEVTDSVGANIGCYKFETNLIQ